MSFNYEEYASKKRHTALEKAKYELWKEELKQQDIAIFNEAICEVIDKHENLIKQYAEGKRLLKAIKKVVGYVDEEIDA